MENKRTHFTNTNIATSNTFFYANHSFSANESVIYIEVQKQSPNLFEQKCLLILYLFTKISLKKTKFKNKIELLVCKLVSINE